MPIGRRLMLIAALPLCMCTGFAFWLWQQVGELRSNVETEIVAQVGHALRGKDLQRNVVQVQQFLSDISATRGQDGLDDGFALAEKSRDAFIADLKKYEEALQKRPTKEPVQMAQGIRQRFDVYYSAGVAMAKAYVAEGPAGGNRLMPTFDQASAELQKALDAFVAAEAKDFADHVELVGRESETMRRLSIALCAAMGLLITLASWLIGRSITQPLVAVQGAAARIAEGDFSVALDASGRSELDALARSVEQVRTTIKSLIGTLSNMAL